MDDEVHQSTQHDEEIIETRFAHDSESGMQTKANCNPTQDLPSLTKGQDEHLKRNSRGKEA